MSSALAVSTRFYPSNRLCSNRRSGSRRNSRFTGSNICVKATAIEKESVMAEKPETFLRQTEEWDVSVRARFEKTIRKAQDEVCSAVEVVDGSKFREDVWSRPGGGGGISRVLQDGNVWEKAGVNVSVVYGNMPPEAYRAANPGKANANANTNSNKLTSIPFFAAGISSRCITYCCPEEIKKFVRERFHNIMWTKHMGRKKFHYVKGFNPNACHEEKADIKWKAKMLIAQLRTSSHHLRCETGRWRVPKEEWEDRICLYCDMGAIETEHDFVMECPTYDNIRSGYSEILENNNLSHLFEEKQLYKTTNLIINMHRRREELVKELQLD